MLPVSILKKINSIGETRLKKSSEINSGRNSGEEKREINNGDCFSEISGNQMKIVFIS